MLEMSRFSRYREIPTSTTIRLNFALQTGTPDSDVRIATTQGPPPLRILLVDDDVARYKDSERTDYIIQNRLRNRNTTMALDQTAHQGEFDTEVPSARRDDGSASTKRSNTALENSNPYRCGTASLPIAPYAPVALCRRWLGGCSTPRRWVVSCALREPT
jgi:hypothetical protein